VWDEKIIISQVRYRDSLFERIQVLEEELAEVKNTSELTKRLDAPASILQYRDEGKLTRTTLMLIR
jgi:hypothetical protein